MSEKSSEGKVFSGNAAVPYAAFNLRDPYYREMARSVIAAAEARVGGGFRNVVDLGAGIGISTMEMRSHATHVTAVEPEPAMRAFLELNFQGDPDVRIVDAKGEDFAERRDVHAQDAVLCCQAFHLFNPPGKTSSIPAVLDQVARALIKKGVFAFDLGPSNFEFDLILANHRHRHPEKLGEVVTELAHPLYTKMERLVYERVRREFPDFDREDLWPDPAARLTFDELNEKCSGSGLKRLHVDEILTPVSGRRVVEFIRNGWAVFFRWGPLAALEMDRKLGIMKDAMNDLMTDPEFERMKAVTSYHPSAVFTAVKP